jgi:mutator protein MutT
MDFNQLAQKASRAAAIIMHNNALLLMQRRRRGHTFYVFPGGTVESGETTDQAAVREVHEETSIEVQALHVLYNVRILDATSFKDHFFYICSYVTGTPYLPQNSIEWRRMHSEDNYYNPLWVPIELLGSTLIYPLEIRDLLIDDIRKGFCTTAKNMTLYASQLRQK